MVPTSDVKEVVIEIIETIVTETTIIIKIRLLTTNLEIVSSRMDTVTCLLVTTKTECLEIKEE